MKTKQDLFKFLKDLNIDSKTVSHPPFFTAEQAERTCGHLPGAHCKNLFLKDNKSKQLWLVLTLSLTKIDLKKLTKKLGMSRLSFANEDLLKKYLGVTKGTVTPFGLINDNEKAVNVAIEKSIFDYDEACFHPLTNEATTIISTKDFKRFLDACGNRIEIINF